MEAFRVPRQFLLARSAQALAMDEVMVGYVDMNRTMFVVDASTKMEPLLPD